MSVYSGGYLRTFSLEKKVQLPKIGEIELMDYKEAITRITKITSQVRKFFKEKGGTPNFLPAWVWYLILVSQRRSIRKMNDDVISCPISWDKSTNFPSHPSLVADAQIYGKFFSGHELLRKLLASLSGWALLSKEKIACCCGGGWEPREVEFEILIHHLMRVENKSLIVQQIVGIRSSDPKHLAAHYENFNVGSSVLENTRIVWVCENRIQWKNGELDVQCIREKKADTFDAQILAEEVLGLNPSKIRRR